MSFLQTIAEKKTSFCLVASLFIFGPSYFVKASDLILFLLTTPIDSDSSIDMSILRFTSHFRFRLNFQSCHVTSTKSKKKKGAKSEMHIPYRDSVLTWLLRENLGTVILNQ